MSSSRAVIFIVFLMVLPIVWTNVTEGISKIDPQLLEMAQVFHLDRLEIFRYIAVPSVLPFFVASATTGLGLAWKAGIAAEVLSTPTNSLGGRLFEAKIYMETPDLLAYTAVIVALSLILEKLLVRALRISGQYFLRHGRTEIPGGPSDTSAGQDAENTLQTGQNICLDTEEDNKSRGQGRRVFVWSMYTYHTIISRFLRIFALNCRIMELSGLPAGPDAGKLHSCTCLPDLSGRTAGP